MKLLRITLNGFALTCINLASIVAAFGIYHLVRNIFPGINQVVIQAPAAAFFSLAGYWMVNLAEQKFAPPLAPQRKPEWTAIFFTSLVWTPLIFVPLHYATQGYVTSIGNITSTWFFQIPTNFITLWLVGFVKAKAP